MSVDVELPPNPLGPLLRRAGHRLGGRLSPSGRVTVAALGIIATVMLFRLWATAGSWFMWDDYIFLADVARGEADAEWLFHSHFSLFMPLSFVLVKIVGGASFAWGAVAAQMLALQLAAALTCLWMLRTLFGARMGILIPLTFYLASPMMMPAAVWWSVTINQMPHHIALFGAVAAHVTYLRDRRLRHLLLASLFLVIGLASYIKAPLIVMVLVGIAWAWFAPGRPRKRFRAMLRWWPAWLTYGALTAGYVYVWQNQQVAPAPRQACELPGVLSTSIVETLGTSVVGGPWNWRLWTGGIDPFIATSKCVPQAYRGDPSLLVGGAPQSLLDPALLALVLSWIVITGLILYRWSRFRHALQGLWILVPYVALSVLLVHLGRAGTFGSQVSAREIRYFSDVIAIAALVLGAAIMPILGSDRVVERRDSPFLLFALPRNLFVTLGGIYIAGSLISSGTYVHPWHSTNSEEFPERVFVQTVQRSLEERDSNEPVKLADVPLPATVALPVIYPYNLPSRNLAPLYPRIQPTFGGTDLSILDATGRIMEATVPDQPRSEPGPVKNCGYLVQSASRTIDIVGVVNVPWWVRMDYLASRDGTVVVRAGDDTRTVRVESGLHSLYTFHTGGFDTVTLRTMGDLSVCVDSVRVGSIQVKDEVPTS